MNGFKNISVALLSGLTLAGSVGCVGDETQGGGNALLVGTPMPAFSVSGPGGATVSSADLAGRRAALLFFRTTCPDCTREMPGVEEAFRRVAGEDIRFVTISKEENATVAVPEYWADAGLTMPYYFDPSGDVFTTFGVRRVPTLYLFGSDGRLAHTEIETFASTPDQLAKIIKNLK
jgi:peroxiredoxin